MPSHHLPVAAGLSGESNTMARRRSCVARGGSPWPDLVRPTPFSAQKYWLAQDVDARDEPGQGALESQIWDRTGARAALQFSQTALPLPRRGSRMTATDPLDTDHLHEECGVFGVFGHPDSAALTALGLHALQHRGQEAAGIVTYDGQQFNAHRGLG